MMSDVYYKLPMDEQTDKDLIDWLQSLPRNKKAEVVRHALRFYKSHLKEGETFYYPSHSTIQNQVTVEEETNSKPPKQKVGIRTDADIKETKKKPNVSALTRLTK